MEHVFSLKIQSTKFDEEALRKEAEILQQAFHEAGFPINSVEQSQSAGLDHTVSFDLSFSELDFAELPSMEVLLKTISSVKDQLSNVELIRFSDLMDQETVGIREIP